jgi:hypothetical protein
MPPSNDRLTRYAQRREARLSSLTALRHAPAGTARAWYVAGELLVVDEHRRHVERYIAADHDALTAAGDEEVVTGLRRYYVPGLDVPETVRAVHGRLPAGADAVAPNHVFLASPFNHGGPYGPPAPSPGSTVPPRAQTGTLVPVTIIDTGVWADTTLPTDYLKAGGVEYETQTDVDHDGLLDGDVGHANFIGGVIASHNTGVELSVIKVLDTFGLCTEAQLVDAIGRIDPASKVVNLSLGGFTPGDVPPLGLRVALEGALSGTDRVVVAAAGNDGNRTNPFWPAAFAAGGAPWSGQVVAVAAHDGAQLCQWSNAGPWVTLAAAGQDIESTFINNSEFFPDGWAVWSGTSFATPRVAAEVAARIANGASARAALDGFLAAVTAAGATFGGYRGLT